MVNFDLILNRPIGSLLLLPEKEQEQLRTQAFDLPAPLWKLVNSDKTAAYIRGLARNLDIPKNVSPHIAFAVFEVAMGRKALAQVPSWLTSTFNIPSDKAQQATREIERELIAPLAGELNRYLATKKQQQRSISHKVQQAAKPKPISSTSRPAPQKPISRTPGLPSTPPPPKISAPRHNPPSPRKITNNPAIPPNILDLKKKWEQPKPPSIPK